MSANVLPIRQAPDVLSVGRVVAFYRAHRPRERNPAAVKECDRVLDQFLAFLDPARPIAACRAADLLDFMAEHPEWESDWTRLRVVRTVNAPFNFAARMDLDGITKSPFRAVVQGPGKRGRPMERSEFQALLGHAGRGKGAPRRSGACFRRALIAMAFCGFRPSELAELQWPFLNLDRAEATFVEHKTARTRKDRAPRIITLHPCVIKMLIWIRRRQDPQERFAFLNAKGRPWNKGSLGLRVYRLRKKLGIPDDCKLYSCRHAWATNLAASGADLAMLAEMLGHTTLEMARYYVHLAGKSQQRRDTINRLKWT